MSERSLESQLDRTQVFW